MKKQTLFAVLVIVYAASAAGFLGDQQKGSAAIIPLDGTIKPAASGFQSDSITPGSLRALVERTGNADAVIFEWNSGGGAVVASKEIKRIIEDIKVPTVCRFRDVAASGAYLASLGCDRIVADSASITGSIGVKSSYLEFSGLLNRLGIEYVNVSSGKFKERNSRFQNASKADIAALKNMTGKIHRQFLSEVRQERNLSRTTMEKIDSGSILLGSEAEKLGLVDRLGGRDTAVKIAENLTGKQLSAFKVESPTGFNFLSMLTGSVSLQSFFDTGYLLKASLL
ncbi:MAG: S49 family peptidase [Candidatus Nanohaloarchaea archaeon]